jgi:phage/plasmid primase-like uncharacterized protein
MTKTYSDQIHEHIKHLQANGLNVTELIIDPPQWIRCHAFGEKKGRGEFAYITNSEKLNNNLLGLNTSFRGPNGIGSYKTYGLGPDDQSIIFPLIPQGNREKAINQLHEQAARKAYGFWKHSALSGSSDYLLRKGVCSYDIRFRPSEQYGNVAVVPMFDEHGKLWSYQLLNPDGTKRHPKDSRTEELFHKLKEPVNGQPIGISESYVTAATCLELIKFPMICAFSCENLLAVTNHILFLFPASLIILFADNDHHLTEQGKTNKGVLKAQEAKKLDEARIVLVIPNFGDLKPSKEASDWNDLVRLKGRDEAKRQIAVSLR